MSSRAFILDKSANYDFSSLIPRWIPNEDSIVYLFQSGQENGNYRPSVWNKRYQEAIVDRLTKENFDPNVDFFVVTGPFIPITVACATLGLLFDYFTMLQFSTAECSYNTIIMEQIDNGL